MTNLEGVYWDLDGTIANTELEAHLPAFNLAFSDFGLDWNWDTKKYIQLLEINGGKNEILNAIPMKTENIITVLIILELPSALSSNG